MAERDNETYFSADLGDTIEVSLTTTTARSTQLEAGHRYLVYCPGVSTNTAWIKRGGSTVEATAAVPCFPLTLGVSFDLVVVAGLNDYIAGIMSAGTATLYITKVSR